MEYFGRLQLTNCYDDGKISHTRQYKVIPIRILGYNELWPSVKKLIDIAIEEDKDDEGNTRLYKVENPQVLEAVSYEYEDNPQIIYFIETKEGGWFGAGKYNPELDELNTWDACGRLDLDGKLTQQLDLWEIKEFLRERMEKISEEVPDIKTEYAYDKKTDFHTITISPQEIARNSSKYIEWATNLWKDFRTLFPNHDLSIEEKE